MEFIYKNLSAQLERVTVTDEEIDRQLQRLRHHIARQPGEDAWTIGVSAAARVRPRPADRGHDARDA